MKKKMLNAFSFFALLKTYSKQSKINISELPKGNYLTEISENGKISKQKFIKN